MSATLKLDDIRRAAAEIAANAHSVKIRTAAIDDYARSLPLAQLRAPELDAATHYLEEPDGTLAYLVQLDAINFGSGYFPRLRKRDGMSGYFTVAASLKDEFERRGPLSAADLRGLTAAECARIFGQTDEGARAQGGEGERGERGLETAPTATADAAADTAAAALIGLDPAVAELMGLFARALNDLGELVETTYAGSFRRLVEAADRSAESLVGLLAEMPFYRDEPFYKRAQLTAADLATAGVAQFGDLDRLTIFADNLVPHVLRVDGVLDYDPDLLARINREELIVPNSQEEREIRACALHAVELIADALQRKVTPMQLDYLLWNRGQLPAYKAIPRHRARTVFY